MKTTECAVIAKAEIKILVDAHDALMMQRATYEQEEGQDDTILNAGEAVLERLQLQTGLKQPILGMPVSELPDPFARLLAAVEAVVKLNPYDLLTDNTPLGNAGYELRQAAEYARTLVPTYADRMAAAIKQSASSEV